MDPNQLLYNHQLATLKAQHALLTAHRDSNSALIGQHAARITSWRCGAGLSETGWPKVENSCEPVAA